MYFIRYTIEYGDVVNAAKKLAVAFYRSSTGAEPVRDWLKAMSPGDRVLMGRELRVVEMGWPIGMPVCRPLGRGLWEVRCDLTSNRIARVFFCIAQGFMVLLHGFVKKTRSTPEKELELARKRQKEVEQ